MGWINSPSSQGIKAAAPCPISVCVVACRDGKEAVRTLSKV